MQSNDEPSEASRTQPSSRDETVYECRDCGNVAVAVDSAESLRCHGAPMQPVSDTALSVSQPDTRDVLAEVFEVPKAGIDICEYVSGSGPVSTGEIADRLDYDRTTVTDYLNSLVDTGFLERTRLNREDGGFVNVYYSRDAAKLTRDIRIGLSRWASTATAELEDATLADSQDDGDPDLTPPTGAFWD